MTKEEARKKLKMILEEATAYEDAVCYVTSDDADELEMAIKALEQEQYYKELAESYGKTINKLTKALEQQSCEDSISRQAVIEWLKDKDIIKTKNQEENARRELAELLSVKSERKTGKWVELEVHNCTAALGCPECGRTIHPTFDFGQYSLNRITEAYPYCHCGVKMEVEN